MNPEQRALELREQLAYHGHRYYVLDDPEIGRYVAPPLRDMGAAEPVEKRRQVAPVEWPERDRGFQLVRLSGRHDALTV